MKIPKFHVSLVRDEYISFNKNESIYQQAAKVFYELYKNSPVEKFAVAYMNSETELFGVELVNIGSMTSATISLPEIFRGAIIACAPAIIVSHYHPSKNYNPTSADILFTSNLRNACEFIGINLMDHIIVNSDGDYYSFTETMLNTNGKSLYAENIISQLLNNHITNREAGEALIKLSKR